MHSFKSYTSVKQHACTCLPYCPIHAFISSNYSLHCWGHTVTPHKLLSVDVLPALAHTGCLLILHCFLQELRQHSLRYALIRVSLSEVGDLQCAKWWRSVQQGTCRVCAAMQSAGYRWLICIHSPRNYCHSLWLNGSQ